MRQQIREYACDMKYAITRQVVPNKVDTVNSILKYFYKCFRVEEEAQSKYKTGEDFNFTFEIFDDKIDIVVEGDLFIRHDNDIDKIIFDQNGKFCQSTNEVACDGFCGEVIEAFYKYMRKGAIML